MEQKIKNGLFTLLFIVLLLPCVQQSLPFIKGDPLKGYFTNADDITFSFSKWFDGAYQSGKNDYLNDHIGFRPDMIRANNQVEFSLFQRAKTCIIGKDDCLFYDNYLTAYNGHDFIGYDAIISKLSKLKAIQDTLERAGITFLLVYEPSKAGYFSEYIPDRYLPITGPTNYNAMLHTGDSLGIHQVDFNAWFLGLKNKCPEALFTKQGIHWTVYGSTIAGDSLIRYTERVRHISMVHPHWDAVEHTSRPRATDGDIAGSENLIFPISDEVFTYPSVTYPADSTKKKPNIIFIGDSFIMNLVKNHLPDNVFDNWQFWFYCRVLSNRVNYEGYPPNPKFKDYDWKSELKKTDCIVMMYTTIGLPELGNGFIEQAYDYYYPKKLDL